MDNDLPIEAQRLLTDVDSIEQLELLLLLFRTRPRAWTANGAAAELRTNGVSTRERLDELVARRLAQARQNGERTYFFAGDDATSRAVTSLSDAYLARRVSVITFIVSKPLARIRSFADAFRLRREPNG